MALVRASSFGISRTPSSPMGSNSCAIKLQINMTMPPNIPAEKMRALMGKLQRRNYKFERRKPAILMLALSRASRHSRSSLSLTKFYESTCFVFDHRVDDRRLPGLPIPEERGDRDDDHGDDDPRSVDYGQEDHDREEDDDREKGFDRSVAIGLAEEEGCG